MNKHQFFAFLDKHGKWITFITLCIFALDLLINLIIPYQLLSIAIILTVFYTSTLKWPRLISKVLTVFGISSFAIFVFNGPIIDLYYVIIKSTMKMEINEGFIFSGLGLALVISILIRFVFNSIVPSKVYSL
jgi:hypothetical protein